LNIHRRQIRVAIQTNVEYNLESTGKEAIAPKLGDKVVAQVAASPVVPLEYEILYPSSDLTASERLELDVVTLGVGEI
jgi:hypothetical protein